MEIKINRIEQLTGKDSERPYWKIQTDKGTMSCFDKELADELWEAWQKQMICYVDAIPSKDGKYINIRKRFIGPEENDAFEEANKNFDAARVKTVVQTSPGGMPFVERVPVEVVKPQEYDPFNKQPIKPQSVSNQYEPTSMYVSYAKDIFIALYEARQGTVIHEDYMKEATNLIKQAEKEFS